MSYSVRSLLHRVRLFRSDYGTDGEALACIKDAAARFCRQTSGATELVNMVLPKGTSTLTVSPPSGSFISVRSLSISKFTADTNDEQDYKGTFDPTDGVTVPANGSFIIETGSAPDFTTHGFYVASKAGAMSVDNIEWPFDIGDIVYSDGTEWQQLKADSFDYIPDASDPSTIAFGTKVNSAGVPRSYSVVGNTVKFYVKADCDMPVQIKAAYAPDASSLSDIPLQAETADCIVDGALSLYMSLPGSQQNINLAALYDRRFKTSMGAWQLRYALGESGNPQVTRPDFFGCW